MSSKLILVLIVCGAFLISCESSNSGKKPTKQAVDYKFDVPTGWGIEKIPFPIEFAPQIPYKGFEDLRFTPGWEHTTSEEHWSYTFLWWLEGAIKLDTAIMKEHLDNYYFGLLSGNVRERHIPLNKVIRPTATITKAKTETDDTETYVGTITMLDYLNMTYPALTLNCIIHKKECNNHTAIIFEISPQPLGHKVWKQLNQLEEGFICTGSD
jgi:hypothetical protein